MVNNIFGQSALLKMGIEKPNGGSLERIFQKQIVDTRTYDTFGNLIGQDGSSKGNLSFQGKYFDREIGLYYFYQRYYNPMHGRFLNEDPICINGGLNLYSFVKNDPMHLTDPFGLVDGNNFRNDYNRWNPQYHNNIAGENATISQYICGFKIMAHYLLQMWVKSLHDKDKYFHLTSDN